MEEEERLNWEWEVDNWQMREEKTLGAEQVQSCPFIGDDWDNKRGEWECIGGKNYILQHKSHSPNQIHSFRGRFALVGRFLASIFDNLMALPRAWRTIGP